VAVVIASISAMLTVQSEHCDWNMATVAVAVAVVVFT
jgi:hypothetical protein